MKLLISALLLLFITSPVSKEEKIEWTEDRKLTWADFKGVPSGPTDYVASTNSGVSFAFSYKESNGVGVIDFTVRSNFYPNLSWYRPEKVSKYILEHEQMHFDISELFARKLRKGLSTVPQNRQFKDAAEKVYQDNEAERRLTQKQYDSDSDHSNNRDEEFRWRAYVAEQLEVYDRWK